MYEARQNKEKVSRRIDGGCVARQRKKIEDSYFENLSYGTNVIQRTITTNEKNIPSTKKDSVNKVTEDLETIESNVNLNSQNEDLILDGICGENTELKDKLLKKKEDTYCQNCFGVSKDNSNNIFVESGLGIDADVYYRDRNAMTNMAGNENKIIQIPNRNSGVHSEVHHSYYTNPSMIWTTTNNCFFCSGYIENKGIEHQKMKSANVFPQIWTYPEKWTIKKNTSKPIWEISNPIGGTPGKYDLELENRKV